MSKTIWSDAEAQLRPIMSNGLIDLPSNSKFSVKDLNYNFDKIAGVCIAIDGILQSDWNQNDDTAKARRKNL